MLAERPSLKAMPKGNSDVPHLRAIAAVAISNNAEAVQRGDIIALWQDWYAKNKTAIDAAIKKANEIVPGIQK